jgi:hypothetical protein
MQNHPQSPNDPPSIPAEWTVERHLDGYLDLQRQVRVGKNRGSRLHLRNDSDRVHFRQKVRVCQSRYERH